MFVSSLNRKCQLFFVLSLLLIPVSISAETQPPQRQSTPAMVNSVLQSKFSKTMSLDGTWEFAVDPDKVGQDKQWYLPDVPLPNKRDIQVPGCWEAQGVGEPGRSNEGTAGHETYGHKMFTNYGGAAWYRKTVKVPAKWQDNKIWLKIGGINSIGWIWVNGEFIAKHYEYAGTYKYDITDLVTAGKSATVAILARNDIPSRQGEVNSLRVYGGLYRSVELEATGDVFVEYAYVEGKFDAKSAHVHATIRSTASKSRKVKLEVKLATLKGKKAGNASKSVTIESGKTTEVVFDIPLKTFQAWSPEQPNLYRADIVLKSRGKAVHGWIDRFGVRKIETRNNKFWLNNKPYFLRGYGDDHAYPLTVCSPADRKAHLKNISVAREFGFNYVRHHTHVELPEYFEAADELGILVQTEIPYWAGYGKDDDTRFSGVAHMSGGHKDPPGDLRTLIRHFRRYVSNSFYCGGNEGHYSKELSQELHDIAKEMDPSRPWMSQDRNKTLGYPAIGQGVDTSTVDFLSDYQSHGRSGSGDAFMVPLLESEDHWPFINHEFLSMSIADDPRLEPKYGTGYAPNLTMDQARAAAKNAGLTWQQAENCIEAGFRLQSIFHKIGLESARLDPRLDGFSMWLLLDFPPATWNGLLNIFHEPKYSTAEYFRTFNQPVVLLAQDPDPKPGLFLRKSPFSSLLPPEYEFDEAAIRERKMTEPLRMRPILNAFYDWPIYTSGQNVLVEWVVSNFGDAPISREKLAWRLLDGEKVLAEGTSSDVDAPIGYVGKIGLAEITLPQITKPIKAAVEVSLTGGKWSNSWDIWVFPQLQKKADLGQKLAVGEELYDLLSSRYNNVVRTDSPDAQDAQVLIVNFDGDAIVEALAKGKKVLCLSIPPQAAIGVQARLGNWIWTEQTGTAVEADHPAFGDFPNEAFMNQPWFRLMSRAVKLTPGGPVSNTEKLMFGNGSAGYFTCVFEANSDKGSVLVSGLNLTSKTHRNMPESAYLLDQMIRYVASEDFSPGGTVDPAFFGGLVDLTSALGKLNGFDKIIETIPSQKSSYNSGFFGVLTSHFIRQTDGKGIISWRSKPLTEDNISDEGQASFQWPATTGWFTDLDGDFTLLVNGKELLKFDVSAETQSWAIPGQAIQERTGLTYDVNGFTPTGDSTGIMTLTLPTGTVKVGESIEIGVKGSASNSKRFFMLYETP
jgi:beta-galactosidase